jgi:hypothetical protein
MLRGVLILASGTRGVSFSEFFIEKLAEGGFQRGAVSFHHFAVGVPDEEFVAADTADEEFAKLEFTSHWTDELEFWVGGCGWIEVADHSFISICDQLSWRGVTKSVTPIKIF